MEKRSDDFDESASPDLFGEEAEEPSDDVKAALAEWPRTVVHPRLAAAIKAIVEEYAKGVEGEPMFRLVRRLRSIPAAKSIVESGDAAMAAIALRLREELQQKRCLPATLEIQWLDDELLALAFESRWGKCRYAEGESLLSRALANADAATQQLAASPGHFDRLLKFALQLQIERGTEPIMVPINEEMASLFGVSKMTMSDLVAKAERLGFLIPVSRGYNHQKGKARTFKFDLTKVPLAE
jgi:hypothetical protein